MTRTKGRAIAFLSLLVPGCLTSPAIEDGATAELTERQGILVVHIQTAVPIEKLMMDGKILVADLPAGEHLILRAVGSGRHRWSGIVIPAGEGDVPFRMDPAHDAWKFRVEAGRTTYPGQLHVGGRKRAKSGDLTVRIVNRSALALRELRAAHPELLERHPPAYGGMERDDFLSYFARTYLAREEAAAELRGP